jgi:hypothetical protein
MTLLTRIKEYLKKRKERRFWRFPDHFIAVILLNENEKVYGCVKNGLALLDHIPKPETGYHYLDIVEIEGSVGKQMFRDDEIDVFKAIKIYRKSNRPTFTFKAILPDKKDYFYLKQEFEDFEQKVEFPWSSIDNNQAWRKGYCTAENIEQAQQIMTIFCQKDNRRKFKDLYHWDYYLNREK